MSAAKKPAKKAAKKPGTLHKKSKQKPVHQSDPDLQVEPTVPGKPDFDQKDQNISPQRKAPGPGAPRPGAASSRTATRKKTKPCPEANIKDDHDSQ
ncbi:MAG: hypothetical protein VYA55_22220 [Pseudomonadota bacterium]|nr:hypothetical protein [Pseudomonadota bacterium]